MADPITEIKNIPGGVAAGVNSSKFGDRRIFLSQAPTRKDQRLPLSDAAKTAGLPYLSVVGRDADDNIVLATHDATDSSNTITPIGVTAEEVTAGSDSLENVLVYRTGHFNKDALNWDPTYTAGTVRDNAFEGASSPTQIFLGENQWEMK